MFKSPEEKLEQLLADGRLRNHILYHDGNGYTIRVGDLQEDTLAHDHRELVELRQRVGAAEAEARYYQGRYQAVVDPKTASRSLDQNPLLQTMVKEVQKLRDGNTEQQGRAREYLHLVFRIEPENIHAHYLAGTLDEKQGYLPEAQGHYRAVLKQGKHSSAEQALARVDRKLNDK